MRNLAQLDDDPVCDVSPPPGGVPPKPSQVERVGPLHIIILVCRALFAYYEVRHGVELHPQNCAKSQLQLTSQLQLFKRLSYNYLRLVTFSHSHSCSSADYK